MEARCDGRDWGIGIRESCEVRSAKCGEQAGFLAAGLIPDPCSFFPRLASHHLGFGRGLEDGFHGGKFPYSQLSLFSTSYGILFREVFFQIAGFGWCVT